MKAFIFLTSFLFVLTGVSYAQSNVTDTHPEVAIYVIDYSTGQQVQVNYDTANLFKDAFVDLVLNTEIAQRASTRRFPGEKQLVITQLDPQANGNAFKLELESKDRYNNMTFTIYTFVYNADQNTLAFLNQQYQRYVPVQIQDNNQYNLNNCYSYGLFNAQNQQADNYTTDDQQDIEAVDVNVTADVAPPDMPDYQQPECPTDGYLWQPGYWGFNPRVNVYYWVPGAWVAPPTSDVVWTPPYWGYEGRAYIFHGGYWGPHVGFYGGINYGHGYSGHGFYGGEWRDNRYHYNTAVTRVNTTVVHNTYINTTVINNRPFNNTTVNNRVSFNGAGGVVAKPTQTEIVAVHERHEMPTPEQNRNQQLARVDRGQFVTPGSNAKPANVAVERVQVRPVNNNNNQQQHQGFQGNNNARPGMQGNQGFRPRQPDGVKVGVSEPANNGTTRPGMNQPANPNGGRVGTLEPANNNGTRPGTNQPSNPNGGRNGTAEPANNGGTRPEMNQPSNPNGGRTGTAEPANSNATRPEMNQPSNPNGGRNGTAEPANSNGTRPGMNQPSNPNGGRNGTAEPGNNVGARPAQNPPANQPAANPANNGNARPAQNTPPANQPATTPSPARTTPNATPAQKPAVRPTAPPANEQGRQHNNKPEPDKKPKQE